MGGPWGEMASQTGPSKLTSPPRMAVITVNGDCDSPSSQNGSVPLSSWYSSMPSAHCGPGKPSVSVPHQAPPGPAYLIPSGTVT